MKAAVSGNAFLSLNTLLNTGFSTPNIRTSPLGYGTGWKSSSTWTSRTFLRGSNCTIWTPEPLMIQTFSYSTPISSHQLPHSTTPPSGFHDLAKDLINKYPLQVDANGGFYVSPLVAALAGKHFRTADLLCLHGAHADVRGDLLKTPLHDVAYHGDLEILHKLIEYNAESQCRGCRRVYSIIPSLRKQVPKECRCRSTTSRAWCRCKCADEPWLNCVV